MSGRRRFLSSLVALLLASAASAPQRAHAQAPAERQRTLVTYTIQGALPQGQDRTQLPVAVVVRLAREATLAHLDVGGGLQTPGHVRAVFVFGSAEGFERWIVSPAGVEVLALLRRELGEPVASVSLRREPYAELARVTSPP